MIVFRDDWRRTWITLTDLGALLGVSPRRAGRMLEEIGWRQDGCRTDLSMPSTIEVISRYGWQVRWHRQRTVAALRDAEMQLWWRHNDKVHYRATDDLARPLDR